MHAPCVSPRNWLGRGTRPYFSEWGSRPVPHIGLYALVVGVELGLHEHESSDAPYHLGDVARLLRTAGPCRPIPPGDILGPHYPLTGLPNRRTLERDLVKSIAEAAREGGSVSLALCDLDRFKLINDTAGHACGDQVLRWFGEKAQSAMRDYSTVARTGGDEFAILLPHTNASDATLAIARLSELVASEPCRCDAGPITVSASFGMATYPEDAQDPEGLMRVADARMYDDKRARESGTASSLDPHDV